MVSKTRSAGIPGLRAARDKCEQIKDPEDRRKCLDDVLFDAIDAVGAAVQEMDTRSAERVELMEQRLTNLIDKGFNKVDERFNKVDERFNKVDARLNDIEKRVGLHDVDVAQIKSWVGTVFERVNAMEPKVTAMAETVGQYFSKKRRQESV